MIKKNIIKGQHFISEQQSPDTVRLSQQQIYSNLATSYAIYDIASKFLLDNSNIYFSYK